MVIYLQDIWIIYDGMVIFNKGADDRLNTQIFGAFLTAIQQFATQLSEEGIKDLTLKDTRVMIRRYGKLLFVAKVDSKVKVKKAQLELQSISNLFSQHFPNDVLDSWNGNIEMFEIFNEILDKHDDDAAKRFKSVIW